MRVISTQNLTKKYGRITAVNNLNLQVEAGQVFGILGPNGSGKTTTLGMLAGVTNATSGSFTWFGQENGHSVRKRLGIILERPNFYPYMNAQKNLEIVASIKGVKTDRIANVLKTVGLYERRLDRFKTYSLGMKQRLSIGSALLNDPEVLVLDEPTNGLDPQGIAEIRELIIEIAKTGKTIVVASHLLDEVQKVCSHFMVMSKGNKLHQGPVADVDGETRTIELATENLDNLKSILSESGLTQDVTEEKGKILVTVNHEITPQKLNAHLVDKQIVLSHLAERKSTLEEKFLDILAKS
ncbi:MAG: ATP-binding cassette domain-containing protein [Bacteroidetes bacterium]|nr:ATP-binding cassette domain-containing protein [Bacteroidota bacterium]